MLYAILGHEAPGGSDRRAPVRETHLAHVRQLQQEGRLVLAGPRPNVDAEQPFDAGYAGSLIVAEFDDLQAARAWADSDPYMAAGVFKRVDVWPFVKVVP